jgi:hypothetical protein
MKKIMPFNIDAYEYNDLSEMAKAKALNTILQDWIDNRKYNTKNKGNFEKAVDLAEKNNTPWLLSAFIITYCQEELENHLSKYLFNAKGDIIPLYTKGDSTFMYVVEDVEFEVQIVDVGV